jgi:hypothetical protein
MMMKSFYRIINHKNMNLAVWTKYWLFLLFLNSCSKTVNSFNVDVTSKVIHNAPARSCQDGDCMFGFSVAQHREQDKPWLLVGAPTADSGQPDVIKGGAVFKCPPDNPGQCDLIPFDTKGNTLAPTGQQYDKKSGQWFGSLVRSSGENGVVLACAPRYVYYIFMDRMDPVGMCFTARNNFRQIRAHRPCVESGRTVVSNLHYINFLFLFPSTPVCSCPFLSVINKKKIHWSN